MGYLEKFGGVGDNWEAVSAVKFAPSFGRPANLTTFPLLGNAAPMVVDLHGGEILFIPCGWAHMIEYLEPALSVGCTIQPDWLDQLQETYPDWAPQECADFWGDAPPHRATFPRTTKMRMSPTEL